MCRYIEAMGPHLGAILPQLGEVAVGDRSKEARYYADRALRYALQIYDTPNGLEAGTDTRPLLGLTRALFLYCFE